ncbi:hypothetical protein [Streptomyces guryensis]|uniref:Uncharacterized protein n=1 Tax=Streptomyces guryensis TaxID=2886947 RepID=A0A9Q3ZBA5_9ACTN|nr:hypothetical protein [Streptomyces guryensis]MCD9880139.1 hypothetical protein [Streptomyces guryensis]
MPEWPGRSARDQAIRRYVDEQVDWEPGPRLATPPALLLLGPHGSGKSSLLRHLEHWGQRLPLASADLAAATPEGQSKSFFDALTELVFKLQEVKDDYPPLVFPSFSVLLMAVVTGVSTQSRERAVQEMRAAFEPNGQQEYAYEKLQPLIQGVATAIGGVPAWVTQVIPVIRGGQRIRAAVEIRRRVSHAAREAGHNHAAMDFLVRVNRLFNGPSVQRDEAEALLMRAFLADLRAAYTDRRGRRRRTAHCLLLLDNVDHEAGNRLLRLLLESRAAREHTDPLLVVAGARTRPETLARREEGTQSAVLDYRTGSWPDETVFQPVRVRGLHVGWLRDLNRDEVLHHAGAVLKALPERARQPETPDQAEWLGWVVHGATRGQPAATGVVLEALGRFPADTDWETRVRQCLALPGTVPGLDLALTAADQVLDRLLPHLETALWRALPSTAAALTPDQAEAAPGLLPSLAARNWYEAVATDVAQPVVRFLLLRLLDAAPGDPGAGPWENACHTLRAAARDERTRAYYDLACEDVAGAVDYLRRRFGTVPADEWCADLSWLQRAPARWRGGLPEPARARYERLVGGAVGDEARQVITRLLVAGWITTHPRTDPCVELYEDPFGDPYAELYGDIAEDFRALRRLARDANDLFVFRERAKQYERKPW